MVLVDLILSLGLSNKYFMEEHMVKQESIFVLPKYNFKTFFDNCLYNKNQQAIEKTKKVVEKVSKAL
jgi:hypothetical protein